MKKYAFLFFLVLTQNVFAQDSTLSYKTFSIQGNYVYAEHYNGPEIYPSYETYGLSAVASFDLFVNRLLHFSWNCGYRYFNDYGRYDQWGFESPNNDVLMDYHGLWTGPGFGLGKRHLLEVGFPIGGGLMILKEPRNYFGSMEISVQAGYKYVSKLGLTLRAGGALHLGRNGFFSEMYSAYFSLGYSLESKSYRNLEDEKQESELQSHYASITVNPYIGSLTADLIGFNIQAAHFLINGRGFDLGYLLAARYGSPWGYDSQFSCSASAIILVGESANKFELSLGANFPFGFFGGPKASLYERIHFGMGYRYSSEKSRFIFKIGHSTTQIAYAGVGIQLGPKEN